MVKKVLCIVVVCSFVFVNYVYGVGDTLRPEMSFDKSKEKQAEGSGVLVFNLGSSSVKLQFYDMESEKTLTEPINVSVEKKDDEKKQAEAYFKAMEEAKKLIFEKTPIRPVAVGHRVVHGGEKIKVPSLIDKAVLGEIEVSKDFAPIHNYLNLLGIKFCLEDEDFKNLPMTAVPDTAFHQTMPKKAFMYALPEWVYKTYKIRKYGFHGSNHKYVSEKAIQMLKKDGRLKKKIARNTKIISLHLGSGCSIAAIEDGKSIDTSMGLTPLEGLVMATRSGDIDATVIFSLAKKTDMSINEIEKLLNKESGLKGLSGFSDDVRKLIKAAKTGDKRAELAIEIFIYRIIKYTLSYTGPLKGVDAIVLTGGIGETDNEVSQRIKSELKYHFEKNYDKKRQPSILTIPANEELAIARDTYAIYKKLQAEQKDKLLNFISKNNEKALMGL
ncbi:MAG: acetate/propionate family kinase [Candidatus Omnitrophica bacterium]|nr:acetate/propionate family kinase [Candidatus Omnitrophota bacterium]